VCIAGEGLAGGVDGGEQPGSKCALLSFRLGNLLAHSGISMSPGSGSSNCSCALHLIPILRQNPSDEDPLNTLTLLRCVGGSP